jgi:hypothetical protein
MLLDDQCPTRHAAQVIAQPSPLLSCADRWRMVGEITQQGHAHALAIPITRAGMEAAGSQVIDLVDCPILGNAKMIPDTLPAARIDVEAGDIVDAYPVAPAAGAVVKYDCLNVAKWPVKVSVFWLRVRVGGQFVIMLCICKSRSANPGS